MDGFFSKEKKNKTVLRHDQTRESKMTTPRELEKAWGLTPWGGTNTPTDENDYANCVAPKTGGLHSGSAKVRAQIEAEQAKDSAPAEPAK